jgi:hypothetical protein
VRGRAARERPARARARPTRQAHLPGAEALRKLVDLAALQVPNLLAEALQGRRDGAERKDEVRVVEARDDLRADRRRLEAQLAHDGRLHGRRAHARERAHGAAELGDERHALQEALRDAHLVEVVCELEAHRDGDGVLPVRPPDHGRVRVRGGEARQLRAHLARRGEQRRAALGQLQRGHGVVHVLARRAVVHPAAELWALLRQRLDDRHDVVVRFLLDFERARERDRAAGHGGARLLVRSGRDDALFFQRL